MKLGTVTGNATVNLLKVGESSSLSRPADPEPSPGEIRGRCRDWMGSA